MTSYTFALFLHILGGFGLIAALAIEATALRGMRSAPTAEQALGWMVMMRTVRILAPASLALILVMGLYLMASAWGWRAWIVGGLVALLLVGVVGGALTGTRMARLGPAVGRASGPLSNDLRQMLRDPVLVLSSRVRIGLVLATLFLMSVKPASVWVLVVLAAAVLIGAAVAQLEIRRPADAIRASAA
jgi:hypothetical protein